MFCPECGAQNDDNAWKCVSCGEELHRPVVQSVPPVQSGKAIASMVCSIAGLLACLFVGQIVGLILGYSARREIAESQGRLTGDGFATAGIVIGWIGLVIDIILVLLWGIMLIGAATW